MRKLWPPTYDDFSVRIWALGLAILPNVFAIVWLFLGKDLGYLWWFQFPGLFVFVPIAGGGLEEVDGWRAWFGLAAWVITNFAVYYFLARFAIRSFRAATNWWPEKRT